MRRIVRLCLLAGTLGAACIHSATAEPSREDRIKAALIYKIIKFVEWPAAAMGPSTHFLICALGDSSVGEVLASTEGLTVRERPLRFRRLAALAPADVRDCHVLYVGIVREASAPGLAALRGRPLLTVGDAPEFARRAGIIGLVRGENKLGFEINLRAAREGGLEISAPLLELATVVE